MLPCSGGSSTGNNRLSGGTSEADGLAGLRLIDLKLGAQLVLAQLALEGQPLPDPRPVNHWPQIRIPGTADWVYPPPLHTCIDSNTSLVQAGLPGTS